MIKKQKKILLLLDMESKEKSIWYKKNKYVLNNMKQCMYICQ